MGFFSSLFNGLGTILGVLADTVSSVVSTIFDGYDNYRRRGGAVQEAAVEEAQQKKDRLRDVNDEIIALRNRHMSRGSLSDQERRRWNELREERDELLGKVNEAKEVKAAEKILDSEAQIEKVEIDLDTSHVLQYNAFADTLGKKCRMCGRQMKLQWQRDVAVAGPSDFYWGCTGWYVKQSQKSACTHTERLQRNDYGLMTDTSAPEFTLTAEEFGDILTNTGTQQIITARVQDLQSDLSKQGKGVELVTCPVHGEHMVLRRKSNPAGLLDMYFLACPRWKPNNQGCSFIEKLKSGSQLAALLKSETGQGIL
jgi:hypothetical protein